jgi:hypothetical protein
MIIGRIHGWQSYPVTALVVADHETRPELVPEGFVCATPQIPEGECPARLVQIAEAPIDGVECFVRVL